VNVAQIKEMLELQHQLNAVINPDWKKAKNSWTRAIWVEAAELMDHIGWKWWKAQGTNVAQAHIELVDIWHFILSQFAETGDDMDVVASELHHRLFDQGRRVIFIRNKIHSLNEMNLLDRVEAMASLAASGNDCTAAFAACCEELELDWDELRRIYVGKNVLNLFRQANGYKQGTYIKDWNGAEDNVRLEETMKSSPHLSPADLFKQLGFAYARVQKEPA
jgi:dimeric dUTPase (all-alpha-NTP-PPase superfamily)